MSGIFRNSRSLYSAVKPNVAAPKKVTGIMKEMTISPVLASFVGAPKSSRPEAVKKIWEHIKANNLQNPTNKREINCDAKLKRLFGGKDKVGMFEMAKLISPHFVKAAA